MGIDDYKDSPAGKVVAIANGRLAFVPHPLPPVIEYSDELVAAHHEATAGLGILRGIWMRLGQPQLPNWLIDPYIRTEAVLSSRIEGTLTNLEDLFQYEADPANHLRYSDTREVANYVKALTDGLALVRQGRGLDLGVVKALHRTLMDGVRGDEQTPGEFRTVQNFIVRRSEDMTEVLYVPPPVKEMHEALHHWQQFLAAPPRISPLIQCAMLHYQFEAIHPFRDGNGRVGRLLITLFLCERKELLEPLLHLSVFFEGHRRRYYECLRNVGRSGRWHDWIAFFLEGVIVQSRAAVTQGESILEHHTRYRQRLASLPVMKGPILALLDLLFTNPIATPVYVERKLNVSRNEAKEMLELLAREGIVTKPTVAAEVYRAHELLKVLTGIGEMPATTNVQVDYDI